MTKQPNGVVDLDSGLRRAVGAAALGDESAFERIVVHYRPALFRFFRPGTANDHDADDLCQDVLMQAFRKLNTLKDPDRFRPWLFKIAVNRQRQYYRWRRVRSWLSYTDQTEVEPRPSDVPILRPRQTDSLDDYLRGEFWSQVSDFMDRLSSREREVFSLRFIQDMDLADIAAVLGVNSGTVKTHLHRAVTKFRGDEKLTQLLKEQGR